MKKVQIILLGYVSIILTGLVSVNLLDTKRSGNITKSNFINPKPTENPSNIKEDKTKEINRQKWFEAMHRAAPGTDWREIELQNQKNKAEIRLALLSKISNRSGIEFYADSTLKGQWYERGAKNVTGSQVWTDYDPETDYLYSVAAGGSIFKGTSSGLEWHAINQEYQFDERFIRIYNGPSSKRLTCVLNKKIVNSDDDGQSWVEADGQNLSANIDANKDFLIMNDANHTGMFLAREKTTGNSTYTIRVYQSTDNGNSYKIVKDLGNRPLTDFNLVNPGNTNEVYLIERSSSTKTAIHKWDFVNNQFVLLNEKSFGIGDNFSFKVTSTWMNDHVRFYIYNSNEYVFYTDDYGASWVNKGKFPVSPWGVGIFAFRSDPKKLLMGEVECYKSDFEGSLWQKINGWGEYYGNVVGKLHADMMHFNEFQKNDGSYFGVICCHGGIYTTTDYTKTVKNITLEHLNNAQYYDVSTQPDTYDYIYAGAQDQGFQRANSLISEKDAADFTQVISGDYGHTCFTKSGAGLWTVYPGGSISFYNNPKSQGPTAWYEIKSDNETVWIPPIVPGPDPTKHEVLLAGGNIEGGAGSFLIRLKYQSGSITATQYPFDFKANSGSEISAIAVSPVDPTRMYISTNNGKFYTSDDGGQTWFKSDLNVPGSHYLYGAGIYPSKTDKEVIYLCGSGYSNPGVLKSNDGGITFTALSNGLPKTMVFNVVPNEDESFLFAATQAGPYVYSVAKEKWYDLSGLSAPTQTYWSVEYIPGHKVVRYGTYGRGIWDFRIDDLSTSLSNQISDNNSILKVFPNPVRNDLNILLSDNQNYNLEIFDMSGHKILSRLNVSAKETISVEDFVPGTYILYAKTKNRSLSRKFVKK